MCSVAIGAVAPKIHPQLVNTLPKAGSLLETEMKGLHKVLGKFLNTKEVTTSGEAHMAALIDTAILLVPKLMAARTWVDAWEAAWTEVTETVMFYYAATVAANGLKAKLGGKTYRMPGVGRAMAYLNPNFRKDGKLTEEGRMLWRMLKTPMKASNQLDKTIHGLTQTVSGMLGEETEPTKKLIQLVEQLKHAAGNTTAPIAHQIETHLQEMAKQTEAQEAHIVFEKIARLAKNKALIQKYLPKVMPLKAAIVLSSLGVIAIAGENTLNFYKNIVTQNMFKVSDFATIANLNKANDETQAHMNRVREESLQNITQCNQVAAGVVGGSIALARFGHLNKFLNEKMLKPFLKVMDFEFKQGKFSASRNQMRGIMYSAFYGYTKAAWIRGVAGNHLEAVETFCRLCLSISFIAFLRDKVQEVAQGYFERTQKGKYAGIVAKDPETGVKSILPYDNPKMEIDLRRQAILMAQNKMQQDGVLDLQALERARPEEAERILKAVGNVAKDNFKTLTEGKVKAYFAPLLFGILGVGYGIAKSSVIFTAFRYKWQQEKAANQKQPQPQKPSISFTPTVSMKAVRSAQNLPTLAVIPPQGSLPEFNTLTLSGTTAFNEQAKQQVAYRV